MNTFVTLYTTALIIFIACDLLWLGVVARPFYQKHLGYLLGEVVWVPAIIFYLLFIAGLTFFVLLPLKDGSLLTAVLTGAFFGLITYATYDLTNHAMLAGWPAVVTVVDMLWGAALGGMVTLGALSVYRFLIG